MHLQFGGDICIETVKDAHELAKSSHSNLKKPAHSLTVDIKRSRVFRRDASVLSQTCSARLRLLFCLQGHTTEKSMLENIYSFTEVPWTVFQNVGRPLQLSPNLANDRTCAKTIETSTTCSLPTRLPATRPPDVTVDIA
jgi:hypothetical protein